MSAPEALEVAAATPTEMTTTPPGSPFWHTECVKRGCSLLGAFVSLAVCGTLAYFFIPIVGLLLLAIAPCVIIIHVFHTRYSASSSQKQAYITFCEAIMLMIPLIMFILGPVDAAIHHTLTTPHQEVCQWPVQSIGFREVRILSELAECQLPVFEWQIRATQCSPDELVLSRMITADGGLPPAVLESIHNQLVVRITHNKSVVPQCGFENLMDASGGVTMHFEHVSGRSSMPRSAKGLANACNDLFPGECKEKLFEKQVQNDTSHLKVSFDGRVKTVVYATAEAFGRAATLEELLKYIAVRRILFKDRVADTGALVVYGLAAAAGFATAENVQYVLMNGIQAAYARMVLSIPLHCTTGLMIGMSLGRRKFLGERHRMLRSLLAPVLTHGFYDLWLMLPFSVTFLDQLARPGLAVLTLILGMYYCRWMWRGLEKVCVADIDALTKAGKVSPPACCEGDGWRPYIQHDDPALETAAEESSTFRKLARGSSFQVFPKAPQCQTRVANCYQCRHEIRVLIFFPSRCPHCEAPHLSAVDAIRATRA